MVNETPKNGTLSDGEIKSLYLLREERAIEETAKKYGALFMKIACNILCFEDAEECVNDAYMKLWSSIPPQNPVSLMAYGAKAVRNIALSRLEYNSAEKRGGAALITELDECEPVPHEDADPNTELSEAIDRFLRGLPKEKRVVFVLRYFQGERIDDVAKRVGCGVGKIKSILHRTRKELKRYLESEGISL